MCIIKDITSARFVGDVTGMAVSIFILMLIFPAMRQLGGTRWASTELIVLTH
jgi:hypothetical protein